MTERSADDFLPRTRRDFLAKAGGGFGLLALHALLEGDRAAAGPNPLAARVPHFAPKAKAVIWCFMDGGPSHVDLFDPKPELTKLDGRPLPESFGRPVTSTARNDGSPLLGSKRTFRQHGRAGTWVSDLYPEVAACADDIAVVRSCRADSVNHVGALCQMNTGGVIGGRPSLGSWAVYGLGNAAESLPAYVILFDYPEDPVGGGVNWGSGFMPALYQGTRFFDGKVPVFHLKPAAAAAELQRAKVDFLQSLNRRHLEPRRDNDQLDARIAAYELAYRMQAAAPEAVDLSGETADTSALYGLDRDETARYGRNCLLARRLVERGVRFVQVYSGSRSKWDAHKNLDANHVRYCKETDRPIAGLLRDLKRRGMLDSTLVVWGGEFGRTPMSDSGTGRDHNPYGFTMWFAGGGIKGGVTHGATDEIGLRAVEDPVHVHDVHATILHLLGLDHERLTFPHEGRDERATVNAGRVVDAILA